jgi:hypothetical protein
MDSYSDDDHSVFSDDNDDSWLYDLWEECPHAYCIWVDEEIDDTDYFFSPRCRWYPHAMCRDEW